MNPVSPAEKIENMGSYVQKGQKILNSQLLAPVLQCRNGMEFIRALAGYWFPGVTYLGSVFEELPAKLRTLLARFKKPERDYYSANYPDDWTL
ncbi:hypothetical protein EPO44_03535 [bacterium]|nr:MAG: hypothetical protein EPO44_03535 [bacterium]